MEHRAKSIRPFIGTRDFEESSRFYADVGFEELTLAEGSSVFKSGNTAFYLQDAHVQDWIDNTMIFMEVEDVKRFWDDLLRLNLTEKYPSARLVPIREMEWGRECFVQDPSGILWHFGEFNQL